MNNTLQVPESARIWEMKIIENTQMSNNKFEHYEKKISD